MLLTHSSPSSSASFSSSFFFNPAKSRPIKWEFKKCLVFTNPCLGEVILDSDGQPKKCKPLMKNSCGSTQQFCHTSNPADVNSSFCCPRINQDQCNAFVREGEGHLNMTRYYYNPVEGDCFPFQYKGLKGNENNFLTQKMCQEVCKPLTTSCFGGEAPLMNNGRVVQCHNFVCPSTHYCHRGGDVRSTVCCERHGSPCDQQLMIGVGDLSLNRYYYDTTDDHCILFNYTGIGGNENNFLTKAECQIACPGYRGYCPHGKPDVANLKLTTCGIDTGCPKDHVCHVSSRGSKTVCCPDPSTFCLMRADPGPCNRSIQRYAYDKTTGSCKPFTFGGCQGNLNNFETLEKCTKICCQKGYN